LTQEKGKSKSTRKETLWRRGTDKNNEVAMEHIAKIINDNELIELKERRLKGGVIEVTGKLLATGTSGAAQSYIFDASKFSPQEAKAWLDRHGIRYTEFIAAETKAGSKQVQTVLFDKEKWTEEKAKSWLEKHDLHSGRVDETENKLRFRQFDPGECQEGSYSTLTENMPEGVSMVACRVKESKALKAVTKKEADGEHPASHYLVVEDPESPSTWHLRVKDIDGNLDHRLMGAAWAALHGGYRGNKYEGPNKEEAISKLKKLYEREGLDLPGKTSHEESLDERVGRIRDTFYQQYSSQPTPAPNLFLDEIFEDYAIVCDMESGKKYKVPYSYDSNQVIFANRDEWVEVVEEYVEVKLSDFVAACGSEVKALGDGKLAGYLVTFGDENTPDLSPTRDFFQKDTNFGIAKQSIILYNHALDEALGDRRLGVGTLKTDDVGVWVETQLQMRDAYEQAIYRLAEMGKLGWSSGTAPHLVKRKKVGKAHKILSWPLGLDASLTPMPADWRNEVVAVKTLNRTNLVELEGAAGPAPEETNRTKQTNLTGEVKMTQEELRAFVQAELQAAREAEAAAKAAEEAKKSEEEARKKEIEAVVKSVLEKEPPVNAGGKAPNLNLKTRRGDDAFKAFNHYLKTGDPTPIRTGEAYNEMKATYELLEGTQYQGQEAVPTEVVDRIFTRRDPLSIVRAAGAQVIQVSTNAVVLPIEKASPEAFVITAEAGTFDQTTVQPMDKASVTIYMWTRSAPISVQLLDDAMFNVEDWWGRRIARAAAITENKYFLVGTGSGQPQGIVTGSQKGLDAASASTLSATEIVKLYHSLASEYRDNVSWFMTGATEGVIRGLAGNPFYFVGTGGTQGGVGNTGFPQGAGNLVAPSRVFNAPDMDEIGTSKKSVVVGNVNAGYVITERKGMTVVRDPYTLASKGEVNILAFFRNSGAVVNPVAFKHILHPTA
jgi:HK97 family phage major capsid protein